MAELQIFRQRGADDVMDRLGGLALAPLQRRPHRLRQLQMKRSHGAVALYALRQSTVCSNASPSRSSVESSKCRPISIIPTGRPFDIAHGTLSPGWPVMSKGAVFVIIEYGA